MMEHPNLPTALAAFQAEMPTVSKSKRATVPMKTGGKYTYTYADLAGVSEAAMPVLARHGLSFTTKPRSGAGGLELRGVLMHTSGQRLKGTLPIRGNTPQEIGSSLTYMRRYLLGCLTGIVTEDDDDGAAAQKSHQQAAGSAGSRPLARRVADAVAWFETAGVRLTQLETKLGSKRSEWTGIDLAQLEVISGSLIRGEVRVEDEFEPARVTAAEIIQQAAPKPPPIDDDGAGGPAGRDSAAPPTAEPAVEPATPAPSSRPEQDWSARKPISAGQRRMLMALAGQAGMDDAERYSYATRNVGRPIESYNDLRHDEASVLIDLLNRATADEEEPPEDEP